MRASLVRWRLCGCGVTYTVTGLDNTGLTWSEGATILVGMQGQWIEDLLCAPEGVAAGKTQVIDITLSGG